MKTKFVQKIFKNFCLAVMTISLALTIGSATAYAQMALEKELMASARQSELYGNLKEAARLFEKVLANNPNQQEAHHRLGVMAAAKGDFDRGIAHFTSALNCGAPTAQLLSDLGGALYLKGEPEAAEQKLVVALTLDPANKDAKNNLQLVTARKRAQNAGVQQSSADLISVGIPERDNKEVESARLAHRVAAAWAAAESQAAAQAVEKARGAAAARKVAEARAAADVQAAATAVADSRFAIKVREIAEAKAAAAREETSSLLRTPANDEPVVPVPARTKEAKNLGRPESNHESQPIEQQPSSPSAETAPDTLTFPPHMPKPQQRLGADEDATTALPPAGSRLESPKKLTAEKAHSGPKPVDPQVKRVAHQAELELFDRLTKTAAPKNQTENQAQPKNQTQPQNPNQSQKTQLTVKRTISSQNRK